MPWRSQRRISFPYGLLKRTRSSSVCSAAFSSFEQTLRLIKLCAASLARALREVDEVDRRALAREQLGDALGQRHLGVFELQRHRPAVAAHGDARRAR